MAKFRPAYDKTAAMEGGYVDHPLDRGGETYKGVARRHHPNWPGWRLIDRAKGAAGFPRSLDDDERLQQHVADFYKETFWDRFLGDKIKDQHVAEELFDTAVNMGVSRAVRILQEALNLLNRGGKTYDDITADGLFGNVSLKTLDTLLAKDRTAKHLLAMMNVLQGMRYVEIMRASPSQEAFARGWLRRLA